MPESGRIEMKNQLPTSDPIFSWRCADWERRLGFAPGKYTQVSSLLTGLIAMVVTALVMGGLSLTSWKWTAILFDRGLIPYPTLYLFFWSATILLFKRHKLRIQRRALAFDLIPLDTDFIVSVDSAPVLLQRMRYFVDEPERFCLYKRIITALTGLQNLGRISDIGEVLRSQAEADDASLETTYSMVRGFLWGIPVLGFIGTVVGLSQAIGGFGTVLSSAKEISAITESLKGVTAGLATAFDTTLLALLAALVVHFACTVMRKQEEEFLDACTDYCQTHVIDRLKVMQSTMDEAMV